jgi:hypothetical protein
VLRRDGNGENINGPKMQVQKKMTDTEHLIEATYGIKQHVAQDKFLSKKSAELRDRGRTIGVNVSSLDGIKRLMESGVLNGLRNHHDKDIIELSLAAITLAQYCRSKKFKRPITWKIKDALFSGGEKTVPIPKEFIVDVKRARNKIQKRWMAKVG